MDLLQLLPLLVIIGVIVYIVVRRNRYRVTNAPLRGEIEAQVRFEVSTRNSCGGGCLSPRVRGLG
jgi:hypothetical protein